MRIIDEDGLVKIYGYGYNVPIIVMPKEEFYDWLEAHIIYDKNVPRLIGTT